MQFKANLLQNMILGLYFVFLTNIVYGMQECGKDRVVIDLSKSKEYKLRCSGATPTSTVTWSLTTINGTVPVVETIFLCPPLPLNCTSNRFSLNQLTRDTSNTMILTLTFETPPVGQTYIYRCAAPNILNQWHLDFIVPGSVRCFTQNNVNPDSGDWSIGVQCNVSNVLSQLGCYSCKWTELLDGKVLRDFKEIAPYIVVNPTNTYDFTCSVTRLADNTTGGGRYSYEFRASPYSPAQILQTTNITVRIPTRPFHDCPIYVPESGTLNCNCFPPSDAGQPPGKPHWCHNQTSALTYPNIGRELQGKRFTCSMQLNSRVEYTLRVAYGPDRVFAVYSSATVDNEIEVTFTCVAVRTNPSATFTWRRFDDDPQIQGQLYQGQTLTLNASELESGSVFQCTATNPENNGKTKTATIRYTAGIPNPNFTLSEESEAPSDGILWKTGFIVVIIILALALIFILVVVVLWKSERKRIRRKRPTQNDRVTLTNIEEMNEVCQPKSEQDTGALNYDALKKSDLEVSKSYDTLNASHYANFVPFELQAPEADYANCTFTTAQVMS